MFKKLLLRVYPFVVFGMLPLLLELTTNLDYAGTKSTLFNIEVIWKNHMFVWSWLSGYLTPLNLIIFVILIIHACLKHNPADLVLIVLSSVWIAFFILVSGIWFPRYLLPVIPLILLLVARQILLISSALTIRFQKRALKIITPLFVLLLIGISVVTFDLTLLSSPSRAPLLAIERWQYIEGRPSGYGVEKIAKFFQELPKDDTIFVFLQARSPQVFRLGLPLYLSNNSSIILAEMDINPDNKTIYDELARSLSVQQNPVYLVTHRPISEGILVDETGHFDLIFITAFPKPDGINQYEIYRVTPQGM